MNRERILEMVEEGLVNPQYLIECFVRWSTSDDIAQMCEANDIDLVNYGLPVDDYDDNYDDSMDGDHDSAMASCGFGTDEDYGYFGGNEY